MHLYSLVRSLTIACLGAVSIMLGGNKSTSLRPVAAWGPHNRLPLRKRPCISLEAEHPANRSRRAFLHTAATTTVCAPSFFLTDAAEAKPPKDSELDPDAKEQEKKRKAAEKEAARIAADTKKRLAVGRIGTF